MVDYLTRSDACEVVVDGGVELFDTCLTQRTSGNISARCGPSESAISHSGVPYQDITPHDVRIVNFGCDVLEDGWSPSTETPMHARVYESRPDVSGIVHTHSPYATTFACLGCPIEPVHYLLPLAGDTVEVATYARHGTEELGRNAVDGLGDRKAVLLRNHGVLAVGTSDADAIDVAARLEFCARMYYQALQIGDPEPIDDDLDALAHDLQ